MDIFLQLVTRTSLLGAEMAQSQEVESGFGLSFDLFESNLINLAIVVGVLVYFGRGILGQTLSARSSAIETALGEAQRRQAETAQALAAEQKKLSNAKTEAAQIVAKADEDAVRAREAIQAKAALDVARMKQEAASDISTEQNRIVAELRLRIAEQAMKAAQSQLPSRLNDDIQQRLVDRSIVRIGDH